MKDFNISTYAKECYIQCLEQTAWAKEAFGGVGLVVWRCSESAERFGFFGDWLGLSGEFWGVQGCMGGYCDFEV